MGEMNTAGDIICPRCGGYNGNHDNNCLIATFEKRRPLSILTVDDDGEVTIAQIGWECPICHRGLSPDVTICEHSGVDLDLVMEQLSGSSGSPINFDSWKDLKYYEDED